MPRSMEGLAGLILSLCFLSVGKCQTVELGNCRVDLEIWKLPPCAVKQVDGELYLQMKLVEPLGDGRWIQVGSNELAWTLLDSGWSYFDRTGLIVVTNVATFDNGPSPFHEGLVRVVQNGKWGLSGANGVAVVPADYDGILEFEQERWLACKGCVTKTAGEHSWFQGGDWFELDRFGKVTGPVKSPITVSPRK